MKLIRWGNPGQEKTGVITNEVKYDTSAFGEDYNEAFFENDGLKRLEVFLKTNEGKLQSIADDVRLGSPVARPSKILCIGLNYAKHAAEANMAIPAEPILFMTSTSSLSAPLGPFLATADEIADPHKLRLWLKLNGKTLQDSNTDDLIFNVPFLISYVSKFMTLLPGDVVSTGTPAGVGMGLNPPVFLKSGDVIELGIDGLGVSRQVAKAYGES